MQTRRRGNKIYQQAIQKTYKRRAEYQLTDSTEYYLSKIMDIHDTEEKTFVPTQKDLLRSRARTTGVIENKFEIKATCARA